MPDDTKPTNGNAVELLPSTGHRELWDPLPDETTRSYEAFCRYRDLGGKRSFTLVAKELNCSLPNVTRWSTRFRWSERAIAFDAYADQKHREQMARERTEMRTRQAQIGAVMQSIGTHALRELQDKIQQKLPLHLSTGEAAQLIAEGSKMERLARGEGTEGKYTQIIVNLGDAPDDPEPNEMSDDTTGETVN
jgi:hypothetical protein